MIDIFNDFGYKDFLKIKNLYRIPSCNNYISYLLEKKIITTFTTISDNDESGHYVLYIWYENNKIKSIKDRWTITEWGCYDNIEHNKVYTIFNNSYLCTIIRPFHYKFKLIS